MKLAPRAITSAKASNFQGIKNGIVPIGMICMVYISNVIDSIYTVLLVLYSLNGHDVAAALVRCYHSAE